MQVNFDKVIKLANFAVQANLSVSHYSALFKTKTGYAPIAYFNQLKIHKACQYLQFTALRSKEIAYTLGIDYAHYLSRLFTKTMAVSPMNYRREKRE